MATSKDYADVLSLEKRVLCYKALYDLHQTSIKWLEAWASHTFKTESFQMQH